MTKITPTAPIIHAYRFGDHEVRTVVKSNGEVWFVATDVAEVLGYRDAKNMVRWLDDDEKGTHILSTLSSDPKKRGGGRQELSIISESGLYHAILKSRRHEAKPFRRWVTEEVLPTIRRTGSYHAPDGATGRIPAQSPTIPTVPVRTSPVGIMGPLFDAPKNELLFMGHKVSEIAREFRAAMQIARDLVGTKNQSQEVEEQVRVTAMNIMFNMKNVDMRMFTTGRPFLLDSYDSDFMSPTNLGQRFGLVPPARCINEILEAHGYQTPGTGSILWYPTDKAKPYAVYRSFSRTDGSEYTHLFWRPSIIPVLSDLIPLALGTAK
ncbi:hypothetical protein HAP94_10775 [Acidithiobacillus ferrivorans]|nr:hypothetical protein [Acidithiobacillus ferrivorans]